MRILVTRTDRLGDVILATPVLSYLARVHSTAQIYFLVQKQWQSILRYPSQIELITYDPAESAQALSKRLKKINFDQAYVLKDEKKVSVAVRRAGIPIRVGPLSTLRSFFCFNKGKLQKRSRCLMHEAEYNLDLVSPVTPAEEPNTLPRAHLATEEAAVLRCADYLAKTRLVEKQFIVIHPGSSGSARYVKIDRLYRLADRLLSQGKRVVVSGGPLETDLLNSFQAKVPGVTLLSAKDGLGLDGMAEVFRRASLVIAHGTGPLHLAAAVLVPTLALFPPLFVLSEKRWGPLYHKRYTWTPPVKCPAKYKCLGPKCAEFDCMDQFDIESLLPIVQNLST